MSDKKKMCLGAWRGGRNKGYVRCLVWCIFRGLFSRTRDVKSLHMPQAHNQHGVAQSHGKNIRSKQSDSLTQARQIIILG